MTLLPLGSGEEDHLDAVCELLLRLAPEANSCVNVDAGASRAATADTTATVMVTGVGRATLGEGAKGSAEVPPKG